MKRLSPSEGKEKPAEQWCLSAGGRFSLNFLWDIPAIRELLFLSREKVTSKQIVEQQ